MTLIGSYFSDQLITANRVSHLISDIVDIGEMTKLTDPRWSRDRCFTVGSSLKLPWLVECNYLLDEAMMCLRVLM